MSVNHLYAEFAKLPPIADLETKPRQRIAALLELLDKVKEDKEKLTAQEDNIVDELETLLKETGREGFRHGWLCFKINKIAGRKSLDKMLLVENGCPAAIINQSYKEGKPYTQRVFHRLREEA